MATDLFSTTSSIALDPNVQGSTFTNVDTLNNPDSLNFIELNKSASSFQVAAAGPNLQVITPILVLCRTVWFSALSTSRHVYLKISLSAIQVIRL